MSKTTNSLSNTYCINPYEQKTKTLTNTYINSSKLNNISRYQSKYNKLRISLPIQNIQSKIFSPKLQKKTLRSKLSPSTQKKIGKSISFNNNNSIYYSKHKNKTSFISNYLNTEIKLNEEKENLSSNSQYQERKSYTNTRLNTEIKNNRYNKKNKIQNSFQKILDFKNNISLKFSLNNRKKNLYENSKNNETNKNHHLVIICKLSSKENYEKKQNKSGENNLNKNNLKKNNTKYLFAPKKNLSNCMSPNKLLLLNSQKGEKLEKEIKSVLSYNNKLGKKKENFNKINIPKKINPNEFKIVKKIGNGSYGQIFRTLWNQNNENYAMKIMFTKNKDNIVFLQEKVHLIIDFQEKTKCDGLVRIYGDSYCKKENDYEYYEILELAERDWEKEINLRKQDLKYYTEWELFNIMCQLVKTLSLLQKHHITHRDIKLQNILLIKNKYKICDFGEARKLVQKGTIVQPPRGSELYMSPIQFFALNQKMKLVQHNTYKSDVFSLGMCILYAANLNDDCLCDIRELIDMNNIRNILESYLSKRYSNGFISLLLYFLEINEKKRPDFIQLENIISQINK